MYCPNCGNENENNVAYCVQCGAALNEEPAPVQEPAAPAIPEEYQPLSPWAYFGLQILYGIPVVGFIFLLIHTFSSANLNRRSFARSYWCALILVAVVAIVVAVIAVTTGLLLTPVQDFSSVEMFR